MLAAKASTVTEVTCDNATRSWHADPKETLVKFTTPLIQTDNQMKKRELYCQNVTWFASEFTEWIWSLMLRLYTETRQF